MSIAICVSSSNTVALTELADGTTQWDLKLFDQSLAEHTNGLAVNLAPNGCLALTPSGIAAKVPSTYFGLANNLQCTSSGLWTAKMTRYSGLVGSPGGSTVLPGAPDTTNFYDVPQSEVIMPITNVDGIRTLHVTHAVAHAGGVNLGLLAGSSIWFAQYVDEGAGYFGINPLAADAINGGALEVQHGNYAHAMVGRSLAPGQSWTIKTKMMYRQVNTVGVSHFFAQQSRIIAVGFWA